MTGQLLELGLAHLQQGRMAEAEQAFRHILRRDARDANAWHLLGLLSLRQGDTRNARRRIEKALGFAPDQAIFLNSLGEAHRAAGEPGQAVVCFHKALALQADYPEAWNNLGNALRETGRAQEAEAAFRAALAQRPDYFNALHNLGGLLLELGEADAAIAVLERALALEPGSPQTLNSLGCALGQAGRAAEGVEALKRALDSSPDDALLHHNLGDLLRAAGRLEQAAAAYEQAVRRREHFTDALNNLAATRKSLGEMAAAETLFRQILDRDPYHFEALRNLSQCRKYGPGDLAEIQAAEALLADPARTEAARISLHFTLGKMWDEYGDPDRGFVHYREGNRLKHRASRFDRERHQGLIDRLIGTFSRDFLAANSGLAGADERPVFIVGMPRSGTTLVEQILSSHPDLFGADELVKLSLLAEGLPQRLGRPDLPYPECAAHLDRQRAADMARAYGAYLVERAGEGYARVSDKMPYNYLHLGLIALLYPNPRIIHCRRDPVDTGLSIFFQHFTQRNATNDFADDLGEIGFYHRQYQRLMEHWRQALPFPLFELRYETLVAEPEETTRALIDWVGLPWHEDCLTPHATKRAVQTASGWQVRQPVYASSVGRWRRYGAHLEPLLTALGEMHEF